MHGRTSRTFRAALDPQKCHELPYVDVYLNTMTDKKPICCDGRLLMIQSGNTVMTQDHGRTDRNLLENTL